MRNWKEFYAFYAEQALSVWAYLWGIESWKMIFLLYADRSFEPTYEELKET